MGSGKAIEQKDTKSDTKEDTVNSGESVETPVSELRVNFDSQAVVGKIITCSYISELFSLLNEHEIN